MSPGFGALKPVRRSALSLHLPAALQPALPASGQKAPGLRAVEVGERRELRRESGVRSLVT